MKTTKLIFIFILAIATVSCSKNDNGVTDPAAFSNYIINNQTTGLLIYSSGVNLEIPISESKEIASAGGLGLTEPPKPSIGLESLILLKNENGTLITALEINPIIDEQWVEQMTSTNSSNFILTVTNDMLEPYKLSTANFVDTYKLKFLELKEVETITFSNGTTSTSSSVTVGSIFQNVNYLFNSNNTFKATGLFNIVTTVTGPDGSTTVGDPVIVNLDESGTYSLNIANSKLTLTDDEGEVTSFEIRDYTETGMTLYSEKTIISGNSSTKTTVEYRFSI